MILEYYTIGMVIYAAIDACNMASDRLLLGHGGKINAGLLLLNWIAWPLWVLALMVSLVFMHIPEVKILLAMLRKSYTTPPIRKAETEKKQSPCETCAIFPCNAVVEDDSSHVVICANHKPEGK